MKDAPIEPGTEDEINREKKESFKDEAEAEKNLESARK